ncbi:class I SAM-dependent methyltransferase [Kitasatospora sp. NPDC058162]|uniref:class I SAM-dependent methyltransferase n=1 Tax=Kitasatospora sp. NPDC058162 TaxID=3346362 RepID=UPI0036DA8F81
MSIEKLVATQQEYYDERAVEYDDTFVPYQEAASPALLERLATGELRGDVLELAPGTGYWTRHLVKRVDSLTAVDGSASMIEVARAKGLGDVEFIQSDLFEWQPHRQFDGVFFAHWLAHVPLEYFDDFWARVAKALKPGGVVEFVDVTPLERIGEAEDQEDPEHAVVRSLADGREFRIVKIFFEPAELERRLTALGWECTVEEAAPGFFYGRARRAGETESAE